MSRGAAGEADVAGRGRADRIHSWVGSVRGSVALGSMVAAVAITALAAVVVPRLVRDALEDDVFDAEAQATVTRLQSSWLAGFPGDVAIPPIDLGAIDPGSIDLGGLDTGNLDLGNLDLGSIDLDSALFEQFDIQIGPGDLGIEDPTDVATVLDQLDLGSVLASDVRSTLDVVNDVDPAVLTIVEQLSGSDRIVVAASSTVVADVEGREVVDVRSVADLTGVGQPVIEMSALLGPVVESDLGFPFDLLVDAGALGDVQAIDDRSFAVREVDDVEYIVGASLASVDRSVRRVRTILWWAVPIVAAAAAAVTWLLASRALRPVRAITARTASISGGTLHERIPVPAAHDEVAELAETMNAMLARLQASDERRRRFVSDASHELRSPIASLRSAAEVAQRSPERTDLAEFADNVAAESDRLGSIVADLLTLARNDERLPPPGGILDLDDIVLAEVARPRSVPVDASGVSAGRVRGRADELSRVVRHLLDNAARHAAGRVAVALVATGDRVILTVDDDGPGVPPAERGRVFERFVRLDAARTRDGGGAGLGLAVVASTAVAAGGTVAVTDSPLGGARFVVSLPAAA